MSSKASLEISMKRSKARRCLFGPVDHDAVRKDLDSMLMDTSSKTNDWNFDFSKGIPIREGRYEWTEVDTEDYVPEFYRKGYTARLPPTPQKVNIHNNQIQQTNCSVILKKPTAVRQLNNLFRDPMELSEGVDNASSSVSSVSSPSVSFNTIHSPSTPSRTARSRRSRIELGSPSQSRISDFMSVRKRRTENDSLSNSQRKLPRI